MILFAWPWMFLLLPLPLLLRRLLPPLAPDRGLALPVPFLDRLARVAAPAAGGRPRRWRLALALLAWILLVTAAARPLWSGRFQEQPVSGRDLMLVVDISGSMRTMDFRLDDQPVSRLAMVKRLGGRFIAARRGDRVGLLLFGARPYLRAPLTYDRDAVRELLEEAEIALAGEQTAIGDAIVLALKQMQTIPSHSRVLVLLTDGANNQGRIGPRQAAELAITLGVRIYSIGIGRQQTAGPNPYGTWSAAGAERFERELLETLAEQTGGVYFHVLDSAGLEQAYRRLDRLEPALGPAARRYLATPLYPWPLAGALGITALLLLPGRRGGRHD